MATETDTVLTITLEALDKILDLRAQEDGGDDLALRIEVVGQSGVEYTYDLAFEDRADTDDDDRVFQHGDLPVVIPAESIDKLTGATLDLPSNSQQGGLVLRNPNRPSIFGDSMPELTGTVEERIQQLLDQQINPGIEAHGGWAKLVRIDGDSAVLELGGGCQGCGMAQVTLRQGIEAAIIEAIPEINQVEDATDHAAGENPFY